MHVPIRAKVRVPKVLRTSEVTYLGYSMPKTWMLGSFCFDQHSHHLTLVIPQCVHNVITFAVRSHSQCCACSGCLWFLWSLWCLSRCFRCALFTSGVFYSLLPFITVVPGGSVWSNCHKLTRTCPVGLLLPSSQWFDVVRGDSVHSNLSELTLNCPSGQLPPSSQWFEEVWCG